MPEILSFKAKIIDSQLLVKDHRQFMSVADPVEKIRTRGFRLARTMNDGFALVPTSARNGDIMALLAGCEKLKLLRKIDKHFFVYWACGTWYPRKSWVLCCRRPGEGQRNSGKSNSNDLWH